MVDEQGVLQKKIIKLLFLGGLIVVISYLIGRIFGPTTWTAWMIENEVHILGGA